MGGVTLAELKREANKAAGVGAVTDAEIKAHQQHHRQRPQGRPRGGYGRLRWLPRSRSCHQRRHTEAGDAWVVVALAKVQQGDAAGPAKAAVFQILGHMHNFAALPANATDAKEIYLVAKSVASKFEQLPKEAHTMAESKGLVGVGPKLKAAPRWGSTAKKAAPEENVSQSDVVCVPPSRVPSTEPRSRPSPPRRRSH